MTTLETLQEAIYRLEDLEALSAPGTWTVGFPDAGGQAPVAHVLAGDSDVCATGELEGWSYNADLIAVLHRTLRAQHALLQGAVDWLTSNEADSESSDMNLDSAIRAEIELAQAILGK
jgi:hypothetical protein